MLGREKCANVAKGYRSGMPWFVKFMCQSHFNEVTVQRSTNPSLPLSVFFLNTTPATLKEHKNILGLRGLAPNFRRYVCFACRYSVNLANHPCINFLQRCSFGLQSSFLMFPLDSVYWIYNYNKLDSRDGVILTILFLKKFSTKWTPNNVVFKELPISVNSWRQHKMFFPLFPSSRGTEVCQYGQLSSNPPLRLSLWWSWGIPRIALWEMPNSASDNPSDIFR